MNHLLYSSLATPFFLVLRNGHIAQNAELAIHTRTARENHNCSVFCFYFKYFTHHLLFMDNNSYLLPPFFFRECLSQN